MLRTFQNKDVHARVWINLQHPEGHTLALEPGEKVDLDLPDEFVDPHLKLVRGKQPELPLTPPTAEEPPT